MNRNQFIAIATVANVQINGTPAACLSEAVVAIGHLADDTEPEGVQCTASREVQEAWLALDEDTRQELWQAATAGKLDADGTRRSRFEDGKATAQEELGWALDHLIECATNERDAVLLAATVVDGSALAIAFSRVAFARGRLDALKRTQ